MNFSFFSSIIYMFMIPLIISSALQQGHAKDFEQYSTCLETKFQCGQDFIEMSYPFWGNNRPSYCGLEGFELTCDNEKKYLMISIDSFTFRVLSINQSDHEIWITSTGFEDDTSLCPPVLNSSFPNRTRFGSSPKSEVIYVYYDCPDGLGIELPGSLIWDDFKCMKKGVLSNGYYVAESYSEAQSQVFEQCKIQLVAPVLRNAFDEYRNNDTMSLVELLKQGFTLDYIIDEVACSACMNSSGLCGSIDGDSKHFQCLCRDGAYAVSCPKHDFSSTNVVPGYVFVMATTVFRRTPIPIFKSHNHTHTIFPLRFYDGVSKLESGYTKVGAEKMDQTDSNSETQMGDQVLRIAFQEFINNK